MSFAFTGRKYVSFSGLYGKLLVYVAKLLKFANITNPRKDNINIGQDFGTICLKNH